MMYVARKLARSVESLTGRQIPFDDEAAVELDEMGYPVVDKQIVSDGHF